MCNGMRRGGPATSTHMKVCWTQAPHMLVDDVICLTEGVSYIHGRAQSGSLEPYRSRQTRDANSSWPPEPLHPVDSAHIAALPQTDAHPPTPLLELEAFYRRSGNGSRWVHPVQIFEVDQPSAHLRCNVAAVCNQVPQDEDAPRQTAGTVRRSLVTPGPPLKILLETGKACHPSVLFRHGSFQNGNQNGNVTAWRYMKPRGMDTPTSDTRLARRLRALDRNRRYSPWRIHSGQASWSQSHTYLPVPQHKIRKTGGRLTGAHIVRFAKDRPQTTAWCTCDRRLGGFCQR